MSGGPDLLLRRPRREDVDDIVAQCQDPESQRWKTFPVPYHEADAHEFFARVADGWSANTFLTFATVHEGRFAGSIGNWPCRRVATRCEFRVEGAIRGLVGQRGKRHDGWSGPLRRGDSLAGEPDLYPDQGM